MEHDITTTESTFGAADVARMTGVSQDVQRDWRRRNLLPPSEPGRRARFSLLQLALMSLTKAQIDSGKVLSAAHSIAKFSAPALKTQIHLSRAGVAFQGVPTTEEQRQQIMRRAAGMKPGEAVARYILFPNYWSAPSRVLTRRGANAVTCYHFATLAELESTAQGAWTVAQIIDLKTLADDLAQLAGAPLVTHEVSEVRE